MSYYVQCKPSTNATRHFVLPVPLNMRALGVLVITIVGIVSFTSPVEPAGAALVSSANAIRPTIEDPVPATEALFDLGSPATGPFPSDWFTVQDFTQNTLRRVSLPLPDCQVRVSDCEDIAVLNELDGFNVQPRLSVPFSGSIDVNTVTSDTLFLVTLGSTGSGQDDMPQGLTGLGSGQYRRPQGGDYMPWGTVVGINQVVWDPSTKTLHVESDELLAQHTRFALIVTRGIHAEGGAPVEASEAFRRFRADVRTEYKQALLEAIQAARQIGVREEDIAVASVFTTQSVTAVLEKIRDQIHASTPDPADFLLGPGGVRTVFSLAEVAGITWNQQKKVNTPLIPSPVDLSLVRNIYPGAVGSLAFGKYQSPDYEVHPGEYIPPVGTRCGAPVKQGTNDIYFNLFLPSGPEPVNGWPVAIIGHGINGDKNTFLLNVASSMAQYGIATIGINVVGHGLGPLSTLTVNRSTGGSVTFIEGGRGFDQNGDGTIGTAEGFSAAPPMWLINQSDGHRQTVADLMQLVRVIEVGMDVKGDGRRDLDSSRIYYFGQSLGGGYGTVFLSIEPDVRTGVLAVPADTVKIGLLAIPFRPAVGALLASRQLSSLVNDPGVACLNGIAVGKPWFDDNMPLRNQIPLTVQLLDNISPPPANCASITNTRIIQSPVTNTVAGAMAIQETLENFIWVTEAASPAAYAPHLRKAPLAGVPAKSVLFLIAKGDQTAPNPTTTAILRAGDLADRTLFYLHDVARNLYPGLPASPHGFAVSPGNVNWKPISLGVQAMAGNFFFSDGTVLIAPEPSLYFQFPIALPLPEDLNYIK